MANAFACRSTTVWPGTLGWAPNPFLLKAVAVEAMLLAGFLYIKPVAAVLNHMPPRPTGLLVAILAFPAVLLADALHKTWKSAG